MRPIEPDTSNPATSSRAFGGVARNVAENLARVGVPTALATLVGDDENGRAILIEAERLGLDTSLTRVLPQRTAEYVAVLEPDGRLAFGLADMAIFEAFSEAFLESVWPAALQADWIFAECNLPAAVLQELIREQRRRGFRLAIDAVSRAKAVRLPDDLTGVDLLFLNEAEAEAISGVAEPEAAVARLRQMGAAAVILTRGGAGAIASDAGGSKIVPPCPAGIVDVTGAGDAFIAGTLASLVSGQTLQDAATAGAGLAARTVESEDSVRGDVSPELLRGLWPSKVSAPDRAR